MSAQYWCDIDMDLMRGIRGRQNMLPDGLQILEEGGFSGSNNRRWYRILDQDAPEELNGLIVEFTTSRGEDGVFRVTERRDMTKFYPPHTRPNYQRPAIPEITDVLRYRYKEGDRIVITTPEKVESEVGNLIMDMAHIILGVPREHVLVLHQGAKIEVIEAP